MYTQPAESALTSEATSSSREGSAEEIAAPALQTEAASRPITRAQAKNGKGAAERADSEERDEESDEAAEPGQQGKDAAERRAGEESESWHSLQEEEKVLQTESQKAMPSTPQSQPLPAPQKGNPGTPHSQRVLAKPISDANVMTPVPIEPATGAHCLPSHSEPTKRAVPGSLQAGFLWSPDQAGQPLSDLLAFRLLDPGSMSAMLL